MKMLLAWSFNTNACE